MTITKIPLVIGVTGHRHLREDEIEMLERKLLELFSFLRKHYPDTPLEILSPLAEGSDRLAAQAALELKGKGDKDIRLIVPLPMKEDEYCKDFKTQEVRDEFDKLIKQAEDVIVMPMVEGNTPENISQHGLHRNRQYAIVGAYVARYSHILIALWDGRENEKNVGGTCQVVRFRLTGDMNELPPEYKPPTNPLDFVDTGSVCHIKVSRRPKPQEKDPRKNEPFLDAGEMRIRFPGREDPEISLKTLRSPAFEALNRFNRDVQRYSEPSRSMKLRKRIADTVRSATRFTEPHPNLLRLRNRVTDTLERSLKEPPLSEEPRPLRLRKRIISQDTHDRLQKGLQNMSQVYEEASKVSILCRSLSDSAMEWIFILGLLMLTGVEVYSNPPWTEVTRPTFLLLAYYICFASAFAIYLTVARRKYQTRYLDYRALAEALRVQIFWQLSGINKSVADFYSRKHREELEWIRISIRALCTYNWVADQVNLELVKRYWVDNQRRYFQKRAEKSRKRHRNAKRAANALFVLGLITGLFLLPFSHEPWLEKILIILMVLFPAMGAAAGGYSEKMGFDFHAKQFETMERIFTRAKEALKAEPERSKEILRELGKAALEENSDWVMLHRERPVELPK